ncbi:MAG: hypothetical protein HON94_00725 [Methylococcales bacterium]|jgi:hypothetical protein|nr:hypothetical protein [Methylococcales bacterium]MBT7408744.1 hypothetical protein [Methylococcales bacterium]
MNKLTLKKLSAIALFGLASTTNIQAGTTGSVVITGTISEVVSVSVTANQNSFSITPGVAIDDQNLASLSINSNDADGYTVSLSSSRNGSKLANTADDEYLTYSVSYNGGSDVSLSTTPTVVESTSTQTSGAISRGLTLDISGTESVGKSAEAYTDTVTVTIAGK